MVSLVIYHPKMVVFLVIYHPKRCFLGDLPSQMVVFLVIYHGTKEKNLKQIQGIGLRKS